MTGKILSALILSTAFLSAAAHAEDDMKKHHAMKDGMRSMPSKNGIKQISVGEDKFHPILISTHFNETMQTTFTFSRKPFFQIA